MTEPGSGDDATKDSVAAGLFAVSVAVLTLEILQTRLFSYCLPPILVYCAVGVAFLGLGASGTLLALWSGWRRMSLASVGALASAGFACALLVTNALFARLSPELAAFEPGARHFGLLGTLAIPYVFAGVAVTATLSASSGGVHRAYRINLLGSAVGCFAVFGVLQPMGAPLLLGALGLFTTVAGALYLGRTAHNPARVALVLSGLLSVSALALPDAWFPFRPEPSGQLTLIGDRYKALGWKGEPELLYGSWDPTGRIEVHAFADLPPAIATRVTEPIEAYFYSQDGSAGSILFGVGDDLSRMRGFFERTLYGAAYQFRGDTKGEDVCVIGLGGGPDMQTAHWYGAGTIDGVDINKSAIESVRGPFAEFTGDPYGRPGVELHRMDGRTFIRSTKKQFDLIAMSGVDTKSIHSAGSLAISENTLYTVEALGEYLDRLKPGGTLAILRFGNIDRLRLAGIAVEALKARGAEHPENHFAVLQQNAWGVLLIGAEPHPRERLERLETWLAEIPDPTGIQIPMYDVLIRFKLNAHPEILYTPLGDPEPDGEDVGSYFLALRQGTGPEFLESIPLAVTPTTDDRPFFFDRQRRSEVFSNTRTHYKAMGNFLLALAALAALFVVLPIPLFLRRGSSATAVGLPRTLVYFAALGLGFMLLEIGLVQKFVLYLGHQSYSLTVVFASLLVGAGMGSSWSGRRERGASVVRRVAVPAIVLLSVFALLFIDFTATHAATFALPMRIAIVAVVLLPLGFALGIPFPTALATLRRSAPTLTPWAIGANGFASVIGSSAALPGAMLLGYRAVFLSGLLLYVLAALTFPRVRK